MIEGPAEQLKDGPRALKIEPALTQALPPISKQVVAGMRCRCSASRWSGSTSNMAAEVHSLSRITMRSDASGAQSKPPSNER